MGNSHFYFLMLFSLIFFRPLPNTVTSLHNSVCCACCLHTSSFIRYIRSSIKNVILKCFYIYRLSLMAEFLRYLWVLLYGERWCVARQKQHEDEQREEQKRTKCTASSTNPHTHSQNICQTSSDFVRCLLALKCCIRISIFFVLLSLEPRRVRRDLAKATNGTDFMMAS